MKKLLFILSISAITFLGLSSTPENNQANEKIVICHIPPGNPENAHPIEISINALQAHLAHGDSIGDCSGDDRDDLDIDNGIGDDKGPIVD